jgi:hypothetical protein
LSRSQTTTRSGKDYQNGSCSIKNSFFHGHGSLLFSKVSGVWLV